MKASCVLWACVLVTLAPSMSRAQSPAGAIPPPLTPAQIEERRREAVNETALQGAGALPGAILDGGKILTQKFDPGSLTSMTKAAERGSDIISYGLAGAKIINGTVKDGWDGFVREGTQAAIEKGADAAGHAVASLATGAAVGSGVALGVATGAAGIAYAGGSVFGTYMRNDPTLGRSLGLRGTIGDEVDNAWFKIAPDSLKELASGTRQVDIDDPAVMQQMRDNADRNRRQATFDAIQRENQEQQQQLQASSVAMTGELAAGPPPSALDPNAVSILTVLDSARAAQAARPSLATPRDGGGAKGAACKLDPKTGCHPGHNEATHPGGCKLC